MKIKGTKIRNINELNRNTIYSTKFNYNTIRRTTKRWNKGLGTASLQYIRKRDGLLWK